jgi:hypothetical protein
MVFWAIQDASDFSEKWNKIGILQTAKAIVTWIMYIIPFLFWKSYTKVYLPTREHLLKDQRKSYNASNEPTEQFDLIDWEATSLKKKRLTLD